jgi:hypothetical protein
MSRKRFVVLVSVITFAVIAALGVAQVFPRPVRTFTATVSEEHYTPGSTVPWFTFTDTVAVRKDGSHVTARHLTNPADGKTVYRLSITDIPARRSVVVDPLSESLSTRPMQQKTVDRVEVKATSGCPGQPAGRLLGFNVNLDETHTADDTVKQDVRSWISPELDCFPLRKETHFVAEGKEDFTVRSVSLLTQGDPPAWLFAIPNNYIERSPTDMFAEQARRFPQHFSPPHPSTHVLDEAYNAAQKPK